MSSAEREKYWHTKRGFRNPEGSITRKVNIFHALRYIWSRIQAKPFAVGVDVPDTHILSRTEVLEGIETHKDSDFIMWLGHCAFIIQIDGIRILTDPFLIGKTGLFVRGLIRLPCPLSFEDLDAMNIDILLLSHEHPDHCHAASIKKLLHKEQMIAVVPYKVGKKIRKHAFKEIIECDWFESWTFPTTEITFTALPAAHCSSVPGNHTLWAGFMIHSHKTNKKIFFTGDTAYGPFFKRDIASYGPFDVVIPSVGAYYLPFPSFINFVHTNPEEAVKIARDIDAKRLIGMHWGTVRMADDDPKQTLPLLEEAQAKHQYEGSIEVLRIGETVSW